MNVIIMFSASMALILGSNKTFCIVWLLNSFAHSAWCKQNISFFIATYFMNYKQL